MVWSPAFGSVAASLSCCEIGSVTPEPALFCPTATPVTIAAKVAVPSPVPTKALVDHLPVLAVPATMADPVVASPSPVSLALAGSTPTRLEPGSLIEASISFPP